MDECDPLVRELRARVESHRALDERERAFLTDACLRRYLTARSGNVAGAEEALMKSLKWRAEHIPPILRCLPCEVDSRSHCIVPLGWDEGNSPIVWGAPARGRSLDGPSTVAHVSYALEHCLSHRNSAEQWVWAVDFHRFGLRDVLNAQIGLGFASVLPHHYPERLKKIVMINRPYVFDILLATLRPFLDARTLGKLCSVKGTPAEVALQLREHHGFGDSTIAFITAAMTLSVDDPNPALPDEALTLQLLLLEW